MVVVSISGNGVCNREIKIYSSILFSLRLVFLMRFYNASAFISLKKSVTLNV